MPLPLPPPLGAEAPSATEQTATYQQFPTANTFSRPPRCPSHMWRGIFLLRENVLAVGNCCYVAVCSAAEGASAPTGGGEGRGAYGGGRPTTACYYVISFMPCSVELSGIGRYEQGFIDSYEIIIGLVLHWQLVLSYHRKSHTIAGSAIV